MAILELQQIYNIDNFEVSWNKLLSSSFDNNPFLTYEWLTSWSKHFGNGKELKLFTVENNGQISLAVPVTYVTHKFLGTKYHEVQFAGAPESDYQIFLVTNLQEASRNINRLIESIIEDSGADNISFTDVPEDSATAKLIESISEKHVAVSSSTINPCPFVPLPNDCETFLSNLGSNMRRNLKVWEKQAMKDYRIKFVRYDEFGDINEAMKIFFKLHQKRQVSKGECGVFASDINQNFHVDIAKSFAKRGWLALFFLTFNDNPVATVYSFEYGQKLYAYLCGFDPDYSVFRPGHLAFNKIMQYGIKKNLTQFDFLRGNEEYKARWKPMVRNNLKFNIANKGIKSRFYNWSVESKSLSHLYEASTFLTRASNHQIKWQPG